MKKTLSLMVALTMATMTFAQGSLLATLSHDGNVSAYYGADALKTAVKAAEAGDVITLSSGQFNATDIAKPITLRGAGMSLSADSLNPHEATIIQNAFSINISDTLSGRILMEGLYLKNTVTYGGHIKNAQFLKCRFQQFIAGTGGRMTNTTFIHCRIYNGFSLNNNSSNACFINSMVCGPYNSDSPSTSNIEFDNCFVKYDQGSNYGSFPERVKNGYYKNCIIQSTYTRNSNDCLIPSSCSVYNCVGFGYTNIFSNHTSSNTTNTYIGESSQANLAKVFKNYSAGANTYLQDVHDITLTDEAAKKYLGTDGTQVGVYGGSLPYDENPTIPQITKCNVASKSTADGKLSVDIEVKAAEY